MGRIPRLKGALSQKQTAPAAAGTAGQVLGLDNSLNPVWLNQSGGGGGDDVAPVIIDSASGAIASFPDGTARPVVGLTVGIEPVQDLHGQSNPYPAGGGKNICPPTGWENGFLNTSGRISSQTTPQLEMTSPYIKIEGMTGSITFSFNNGFPVSTGYAGWRAICFYSEQSSDGFIYPRSGGEGTTALTASIPESAKYIRVSCRTYGNTIQPQVENAASASAFAPYTNICPISGWEGVSVFREAAYNAQASPVLTISWQSEAGTVYGGHVTLNEDGSADLTVTHTSQIFTGAISEEWTVTQTGSGLYRFQIFPTGIKTLTGTSRADVISNLFKPDTSGALGTITHYGSRIWIFPPETVTTVEQLQTWLASNNLQAVFELATPVTYHNDSDAGFPFDTLLGQNNIWATTGDVSVDYRADTKLYINKAIAAAVAAL